MRHPFAPEQIGNHLRSAPANPAAGANLIVTVPSTPDAGEIWKVDSIRFRLVTDANVANRDVGIEFRTSGAVLFNSAYPPSGTPQTAGQTRDYMWQRGLPVHEIFIPNLRSIWLPDVWVAAGETIRTAITGIQVGDQISAVVIAVRSWRITAN